jgi:hypothetical protein
MKYHKIVHNAKSRKDVSNPHHGLTHEELLEKADVQKFDGNYAIEKLKNGRIIVLPKEENKKA